MAERKEGFTRREFCLKGGIALSLFLAGCRTKSVQPIPTETVPRFEPERTEELLSGFEIQKILPLIIGNTSSYRLEGLRRKPFEEAVKNVKVNPNQLLWILLEDDTGETSGKPVIKTTLQIFTADEEGFGKPLPGRIELVTDLIAEGLTEEERLSFNVTVSFRTLLAYASYFQPYIKDGELSEDEFEKIQQELTGEVREKIKTEIMEEVANDKDKLIFIFAPPETEA